MKKRIIGIIILVIILVVVGTPICVSYYTPKKYTVTITDKDIKNYSESSKFLVFTTDTETEDVKVFSIEDTFYSFRFDSANDYAQLEEGKTYRVEVIGWRIPFLSEYENIIHFEEVSPEE